MGKSSEASDGFCKQLIRLLEHAKGEKIDIAAAVYRMIRQEEKKEAAFRFFLENADRIKSAKDEEVESFCTASEKQKLDRECGRLAKGILDNIIGKKLGQEAFYCELWERGIEENTNFPEEKEKVYALYRIWMDGRIPYFELEDGLRMPNEKYVDIAKKKEEEIRMSIFIMNSEFSQRTERSSQLLRVLEMCETEEEKAVLLAQILSMAERMGVEEVLDRRKGRL